MRAARAALLDDLAGRLRAAGASVARDDATALLLINGECSAAVVPCRPRPEPAGPPRWLVRRDRGLAPDITVLARMDAAKAAPADYYLLPTVDVGSPRLLLCACNGAALDTYQFDSLDYFTTLAARRALEEVCP